MPGPSHERGSDAVPRSTRRLLLRTRNPPGISVEFGKGTLPNGAVNLDGFWMRESESFGGSVDRKVAVGAERRRARVEPETAGERDTEKGDVANPLTSGGFASAQRRTPGALALGVLC